MSGPRSLVNTFLRDKLGHYRVRGNPEDYDIEIPTNNYRTIQRPSRNNGSVLHPHQKPEFPMIVCLENYHKDDCEDIKYKYDNLGENPCAGQKEHDCINNLAKIPTAGQYQGSSDEYSDWETQLYTLKQNYGNNNETYKNALERKLTEINEYRHNKGFKNKFGRFYRTGQTHHSKNFKDEIEAELARLDVSLVKRKRTGGVSKSNTIKSRKQKKAKRASQRQKQKKVKRNTRKHKR